MINHADHDHPATPTARARCRATMAAGGATAPARGVDTRRTCKPRQAAAQGREQASVEDPPVGATVEVIKTSGERVVGQLLQWEPTGWATIDKGTDARGRWLGVRHIPDEQVFKIFVETPAEPDRTR